MRSVDSGMRSDRWLNVNQPTTFVTNCGRRLVNAPAAVRNVTASGRSLALTGPRGNTQLAFNRAVDKTARSGIGRVALDSVVC